MQNPIHKALSSIQNCGVKALLMGGQACVLYGAAEFSRDIDLAILASETNLNALQGALEELEVTTIAIPDFDKAKKTQRDKDWPMIKRLVEASYFRNESEVNNETVEFWFHELRTPEILL